MFKILFLQSDFSVVDTAITKGKYDVFLLLRNVLLDCAKIHWVVHHLQIFVGNGGIYFAHRLRKQIEMIQLSLC